VSHILTSKETRLLLQFTYNNNCLSYTSEGSFHAVPALSNVTIAGLQEQPQRVSLKVGGSNSDTSGLGMSFGNGVLKLSKMDQLTSGGAFEQNLELTLS
jgi:alpha-glucosidase